MGINIGVFDALMPMLAMAAIAACATAGSFPALAAILASALMAA